MTEMVAGTLFNPSLHIAFSLLLAVAGVFLVLGTMLSAVRTVIVPRGTSSFMNRIVFRISHALFSWFSRRRKTYEQRDHVMAHFAPVSLVLLGMFWLAAVASGYSLLYWATGTDSLASGLVLSGSSLTTLGFIAPEFGVHQAMGYSEAILGLFLGALMITYFPSLYGVFARREVLVASLEVRGGTPPSAGAFIIRFHQIGWLDRLDETFLEWERWFAELEESHTSYLALMFFRSPVADRSWITAAGTVLDAAALSHSCVDVKYPRGSAAVCIRSGFLALRRLADFFGLTYNKNPEPSDPITIMRPEFDAVWDDMERAGVPLVDDKDQAWLDYSGWRVNYDSLVLDFAEITMAPYAPWTSDRSSLSHQRPRIARFGNAAVDSFPVQRP